MIDFWCILLPYKLSFLENEVNKKSFNNQFKSDFTFLKNLKYSEEIQITKKGRNEVKHIQKVYKIKKNLLVQEWKFLVIELQNSWIKTFSNNKKFYSFLFEEDLHKQFLDKFESIPFKDLDEQYEFLLLSLEENRFIKFIELDDSRLKEFAFENNFMINFSCLIQCNDRSILKKNEIELIENFLESFKRKNAKKYSLSRYLFLKSL